jgi:sarcosine oxidase, subunit gamma
VSVLAPEIRPRSFVSRRLAALGARMGRHGDVDAALDVPGGTRETLARLGLVDLSPLPRIGFKGRGTIPAMQAAGLSVEAAPNRAFRQNDGGLCAVLAPGEILLLSGPGGDATLVKRLEADWSLDQAHGTYLVPRASTHAWFRITGSFAPDMFAKICGVDLRPHKFSELSIAQTSVFRLTGIVIREDLSGTPGYHLLADSASAEYAWDCLIDAMAEFGGRPAGLAALLALGGPP